MAQFGHVELVSRLAGLYNLEGVVIWLSSPHRLLKGEIPWQVWERQPERRDEVLALVAQMEEGAFV